MAPSWILLERKVRFVHGGGAPARFTRVASNRMRKVTLEDAADSMAVNLEAMKPDPQVFAPPAVNHLSMVQQMDARHKMHQMDGLCGGIISSTDKALVLLYTGGYQPGFSNNPLSGCYLVYDASSNSVKAIPQLPHPCSFRGLGRGAAILSISKGTYMVVELVAARSGFPDAVLFLWRSSRKKQDAQWIRKEVRLPRVFSLDYFFRIDMAFAYADSRVCWVDLLKGVLICNNIESTNPHFTFVPLPKDCSIIDVEHRRRPHTEEFRTMGSVGDTIKFVSLHGYNEGLSCEDVKLQTWTLLHDLKTWVPGGCLVVRDLWNSFFERNLPKVIPSFPVISKDEPEVVYLVLNDIHCEDSVDILGNVCGVNKMCKAQYVLRLDTVQKEVLCDTKFIPDNRSPHLYNIIATEFTAHLQWCSMEGELVEAREAGGSSKQKKHGRKQEADDALSCGV